MKPQEILDTVDDGSVNVETLDQVVSEPVLKQKTSRVIKDHHVQRISKHGASKKGFEHKKPAKSRPVDRPAKISNHEAVVAQRAKKMGITPEAYNALFNDGPVGRPDAKGILPVVEGLV
jgi:hypothetical protein